MQSSAKKSCFLHPPPPQSPFLPQEQDPCQRWSNCIKPGSSCPMAHVLSLVSRALQEQNPEYAHPFPAHRGPAINLIPETPTAASVTLSQPYPPQKGQEGPEKPRGSVLTEKRPKAHPIFFILWQESALLRKRNTDPEERGMRNKSEPGKDTGEGRDIVYKSVLAIVEWGEELGPSSRFLQP